MSESPPRKIAIDHDDYHAKFVGWTADGRQFILTMPFQPGTGLAPGREFIALYLFNREGDLLEAKVDDLGLRGMVDQVGAGQLHDQRLKELGDIRFGRVEVAPFTIRRFNIEFGLIVRMPEEDDDVWAVEMQPGNFMAFFAPWDSGEYDT